MSEIAWRTGEQIFAVLEAFFFFLNHIILLGFFFNFLNKLRELKYFNKYFYKYFNTYKYFKLFIYS